VRTVAVLAQVIAAVVLAGALTFGVVLVWRHGLTDPVRSDRSRNGVAVVTYTSFKDPAAYLDVAIVGRVVEIERDEVEVIYAGSDPPSGGRYRIAIVAVEEPLFRASGLTRVRVGFRVLKSGIERDYGTNLKPNFVGCFYLSRQRGADFYTLAEWVYPTDHQKYDSELERLKKIARTLDDPVAALKAKDLNDRFDAASILLSRYNEPRFSKEREPIPEEENKLIVALLTELPWALRLPIDGLYSRQNGGQFPNRRDLWWYLARDETRLKCRSITAAEFDDPAFDAAKVEEKATTKFLKENADTIRLKRFAQK
jgi:hypothetical protein